MASRKEIAALRRAKLLGNQEARMKSIVGEMGTVQTTPTTPSAPLSHTTSEKQSLTSPQIQPPQQFTGLSEMMKASKSKEKGSRRQQALLAFLMFFAGAYFGWVYSTGIDPLEYWNRETIFSDVKPVTIAIEAVVRTSFFLASTGGSLSFPTLSVMNAADYAFRFFAFVKETTIDYAFFTLGFVLLSSLDWSNPMY